MKRKIIWAIVLVVLVVNFVVGSVAGSWMWTNDDEPCWNTIKDTMEKICDSWGCLSLWI